MSKNLIMNSWVEEVAKLSAKETVKLYTSMTVGKSEAATDLLLTKFIQYYITELLVKAFTSHKDKNFTDRQAYEFTKDYFNKMKFSIQTEVAAGFEAATEIFSGKRLEYWCSITPVSDPINKLEC